MLIIQEEGGKMFVSLVVNEKKKKSCKNQIIPIPRIISTSRIIIKNNDNNSNKKTCEF